MMKHALFVTGLILHTQLLFAAEPNTLPDTKPLTETRPLDEVMVAGIDRFAMRALKNSPKQRLSKWQRDYSSPSVYEKSVAKNREQFRTIIGAVDPRVKQPVFEYLAVPGYNGVIAESNARPVPRFEDKHLGRSFQARYIRWPVLEGVVEVTGEGIMLEPSGKPVARVIVLPDADWTPEEFLGIQKADDKLIPAAKRLPIELALRGCQVVIPLLINRECTYSGRDDVYYTNIPHRAWIYRMGFELGRHIIGYEVQKVQAAIDAFDWLDKNSLQSVKQKSAASAKPLPIGVAGFGEGGLLALYAAALDTRIDVCLVCGYFNQRENLWAEPIYRNVWSLLTEFGDADLASLVAPRTLILEASAAPEVDGPPAATNNRPPRAAPGAIRTPLWDAFRDEVQLAQGHFEKLKLADNFNWFKSENGQGPPATTETVIAFSKALKRNTSKMLSEQFAWSKRDTPEIELFDPEARQKRQFEELVQFTLNVFRNSHKVRDKFWSKADRSSVEKWVSSTDWYRNYVHEEMIGKLPDPTQPFNTRSRKVIDNLEFTGYEIVLDVYEDVIASGIVLLPKDLQPGEKRPVVVCQHGLEGTPMQTITTDTTTRAFRAYKGFSSALAERGFIVYAPQNPYRGQDRFRVLQRKSNPMKRSLYSYIIPQHHQTLKWLATLPHVDADRIAFYGLSYGGKTAMRVPQFLVPGSSQPGYCLSICSGDFNEWVLKTATIQARTNYVFTHEYEMWEWNLGHIANYAELAALMTPRPFMVERGHRDGVAYDEWVAWEYAKVRRHYDELGIGDKTTIEFFNGPHTINGVGTYDFLHNQTNWPKR